MKLGNIDCKHLKLDGTCRLKSKQKCECLDNTMYCSCPEPHFHDREIEMVKVI